MFTKNVENMSLSWLVKYITKTFHEPVRKNLKKLDLLVESIVVSHTKNYPELINLQELFRQFKTEVLKHVTKEDLVVFPTILRFERIYTDKLINLSDNFEVINSMVNDIVMKNQHKEFDLYLSSIIELLEWSEINNKGIKDFETAKSIFISIKEANVIHSKLENEDLYFKWMYLQNKLKEKLSDILEK